MKILELETLMNEQILRPWQYGSIVFDQFALKTKERFDQMGLELYQTIRAIRLDPYQI